MRKGSVLIVLTCLFVVPSAAYAQASIAGVVRDTTGAVLPGVTVEATSPSLIEKVRSAVTDATGQYRIEDLRPGTYTVNFALPGFSTVKREGIELTGSFTASVNAELRVGAVEETVTVAGESPIVDVQSATREQVISGDLISSIPSARVYASLAVLIPGVTVNSRDVDGIQGPSSPTFGIHGGPSREGRAQVDGLSVGASLGGSGVSGYIPDVANSQEVTVNTSGALGEAEVGGPVINVVPRVGGNSVKGTIYVNGASSAMQGSNYTQALRDAGLTAPAELIKLWDVNGAVGGPIRKDRLWYFLSGRHQGSDQYVTNMYQNLNAGNAAAWTYEPDFSQQATNDGIWKGLSLRLTLQATPNNKFNIFWDEQSSCRPKRRGRQRDDDAGSDARVLLWWPLPFATGHLDVAGVEPFAAGGRVRDDFSSMGQQGKTARQPRPDSSSGAGRNHPRAYIPLAGLGRWVDRNPDVAGRSLVCHRVA